MSNPLRSTGAAARDAVRATVRFLSGMHPVKLVALGYLSYVLLGFIALCIPWSQAGPPIPALDNLFIATSAVSTTGLTTVSTSDSYSFVGELVVLALIQLGGMGYMTLGSFVMLATRGELSASRVKVLSAAFTLPEGMRAEQIVKSVVVFTTVVETIGAVALYLVFRRAGMDDALWSAIFHSVSSFCTAGFSLYNNSFEGFAGDFWLNAIVAALSYLGAIGFLVAHDAWSWLSGRRKRMTFTSKIILTVTFWLSVGGTALLLIVEPGIRAMPAHERVMVAFFQSMTSMTTVGFNTYPIGAAAAGATTVLIFLMILGASPSGTGGGLKSTTVSALIALVMSNLRGDDRVTLLGKEVPWYRLRTAAASLALYALTLFVGVFCLTLTEKQSMEDLWFEATSALGTVGLSRGITSALTPLGKWVIIGMMFVGRLGPLTFGIALFTSAPDDENPAADLAV